MQSVCFLYRYGIVLKALDLTTEAIENLECSIQIEPLFWGAWEELSGLCKDKQSVGKKFQNLSDKLVMHGPRENCV